jgi:hypothetical protein
MFLARQNNLNSNLRLFTERTQKLNQRFLERGEIIYKGKKNCPKEIHLGNLENNNFNW